MTKSLIQFFLILVFGTLSYAQFFSFDDFFGGGSQESSKSSQSPKEVPKAGAADNSPTWLLKQFDQAICPDYLCPDTLVCALTPLHCPCRWPHDIKCIYGKQKENDLNDMGKGFICARAHQPCEQIFKHLKYS